MSNRLAFTKCNFAQAKIYLTGFVRAESIEVAYLLTEYNFEGLC